MEEPSLQRGAPAQQSLSETQQRDSRFHHNSLLSNRTPTRAIMVCRYVLLVFASFLQASTIMLIHVGAVHFNFSTPGTLLVRSFISTILSTAFLVLNPSTRYAAATLTTYQLILLWWRGFFGAAAGFTLYVSLRTIPVGEVVTIFSCTAAFATMLSSIFLSQPFTAVDGAAIWINFAGVALVSHPDFRMVRSSPFSQSSLDPGRRPIGVISAILAAVLNSIAFTLIRKMGGRVHHMLGVLAGGLNMGLLTATVVSNGTFKEVILNKEGLTANVLGAFCTFVAHGILNLKLQTHRTWLTIVVRSLVIPFSFSLGSVFLGERPTAVGIVGSVLVMTGIVMTGTRELMRQ